ncbi:hypothetical protein ADUPG1_011443 [Aduncisulcus paluster]|uniref:CBF1-interacting co-repressor CIR N-terminal domain-containing protein n=1 Tax=Aduncisulcus paluster TaxID=2918883 RepID=A0ABQ5JVX6_9EUKA|nr:hypothetical protein ADUPG1_011443 [Aduncisulcus paluster]
MSNLNAHKLWHVGTKKRRQELMEREKQEAAKKIREQSRIETLKKEIAFKKTRKEQEARGIVPEKKNIGLDWMYSTVSARKEHEDSIQQDILYGKRDIITPSTGGISKYRSDTYISGLHEEKKMKEAISLERKERSLILAKEGEKAIEDDDKDPEHCDSEIKAKAKVIKKRMKKIKKKKSKGHQDDPKTIDINDPMYGY